MSVLYPINVTASLFIRLLAGLFLVFGLFAFTTPESKGQTLNIYPAINSGFTMGYSQSGGGPAYDSRGISLTGAISPWSYTATSSNSNFQFTNNGLTVYSSSTIGQNNSGSIGLQLNSGLSTGTYLTTVSIIASTGSAQVFSVTGIVGSGAPQVTVTPNPITLAPSSLTSSFQVTGGSGGYISLSPPTGYSLGFTSSNIAFSNIGIFPNSTVYIKGDGTATTNQLFVSGGGGTGFSVPISTSGSTAGGSLISYPSSFTMGYVAGGGPAFFAGSVFPQNAGTSPWSVSFALSNPNFALTTGEGLTDFGQSLNYSNLSQENYGAGYTVRLNGNLPAGTYSTTLTITSPGRQPLYIPVFGIVSFSSSGIPTLNANPNPIILPYTPASGSISLSGINIPAYSVVNIRASDPANFSLGYSPSGPFYTSSIGTGSPTVYYSWSGNGTLPASLILTGGGASQISIPIISGSSTSPTSPTTSGSTSVCQGNALTHYITCPVGSTLSYSGNEPQQYGSPYILSGSSYAITLPTSAAARQYNYTIYCGNSAGISAPTYLTLQVISSPQPNFGGNQTVAQGTALSLSNTVGCSGTLFWNWSGPNNSFNSGQGNSIPFSASATGVYNFTATCVNSPCNSQPALFTITNVGSTTTTTASLTITLSQYTVCQGTPIIATVACPSGSFSAVLSTNITGAFTYTAACSSGSGVMGPVASATYTVVAAPGPPAIAGGASFTANQNTPLSISATCPVGSTLSTACCVYVPVVGNTLSIPTGTTGTSMYLPVCVRNSGGTYCQSPAVALTVVVSAGSTPPPSTTLSMYSYPVQNPVLMGYVQGGAPAIISIGIYLTGGTSPWSFTALINNPNYDFTYYDGVYLGNQATGSNIAPNSVFASYLRLKSGLPTGSYPASLTVITSTGQTSVLPINGVVSGSTANLPLLTAIPGSLTVESSTFQTSFVLNIANIATYGNIVVTTPMGLSASLDGTNWNEYGTSLYYYGTSETIYVRGNGSTPVPNNLIITGGGASVVTVPIVTTSGTGVTPGTPTLALSPSICQGVPLSATISCPMGGGMTFYNVTGVNTSITGTFSISVSCSNSMSAVGLTYSGPDPVLSATYTVYPTPPQPNFGTNLTALQNSTLSLTSTVACMGALNWQWRGPFSTFGNDQSGSSIPVLTSYEGVVSFTATCRNNNCVSMPALFSVTVTQPTPTTVAPPTVLISQTAICQDTPLSVTVICASAPSPLVSPISTTITGVTNYTFICINGDVESTPTVVSIVVNPRPAPVVTSSTIIAGQTLALSVACGSSVSWNDGVMATSRVVSPSATTSYTAVCAGQESSCPTTSIYAVNVEAAAPASPIITLSQAAVCQGSPLSVTTVCASGTPSTPVASLSTIITGTFVYTATCSSGSLVSAPGSATYTVQAIPGSPVILSSAGSSYTAGQTNGQYTVTQGGSLSVSVSCPTGSSLVAMGVTVIGGSLLVPATSIIGIYSSTLTCRTTLCVSAPTTITVTVVPVAAPPASPTITLSSLVACQNTPLSATVACPSSITTIALNTQIVGVQTFTATCGGGTVVAAASYTVLPQPAPPTVAGGAAFTATQNVPFSLTATCPTGQTLSTACCQAVTVVGNTITIPTASTGTTAYFPVCIQQTGSTFCSSFGVGVTVTVTPAAPATVAAPTVLVSQTVVCQGTPVSVTSICATGAVTFPLATSITGVFAYSFTCTNGGVVSNAAVVTLVVNPRPAPVFSSFTITVGQPLVLTVACPSSVTWHDGFTVSARPVSPTATTSYTAVCAATNGTCPSTFVYSVTVSPLPSLTLNVTQGQQGCDRTATVSIAGSMGAFAGPYSLTLIPAVGQVYSTTGYQPFTMGILPGSYTFLVTDANGARGSITASFSAVAVPTLAIQPTSSTVCQGSPLSLTATGCSSGTVVWSTGAVGTVIPVLTNTAGLQIASATCYATGGCSTTATATVVITPLPTIRVISTPTCGGTILTLNRTEFGIPLGSYLLLTGSSSVTVPGGLSSVSISVAPGTYTIIGFGLNGCVSEPVPITVNTPTALTASLTTNGTLTCETSVTLIATASGNETYIYSVSGPGNFAESNTTGVFSVNTPGVYSLTVSNPNGCTALATTTVSSNTTAPTASLTASGILTCANTVVTLQASGGGTYQFSGPGLLPGLPGSGTIAIGGPGTTAVAGNSTTPTASVNLPGVYFVFVTAPNGCTALASTTVGQNSTLPVVSLAASGTITCANPRVTLTASGGTSYTFSGPGLSQSGSSNTALVSQAGTYSIVATGANGCQGGSTISVTSDGAVPVVTNFTGGTLTCDQTSVTLVALATGGSSLTYSVAGPGNFAQLNTTGQFLGISTAGVYSLTVRSSNGCLTTVTTTISSNTVLPIATLSTSNSGVITCTTRSITLTASGGVNYVFRGPGLNQTSSSPFAVVTRAGVYTVVVSGTNGCEAIRTVTVTENDTPPVATLTGSGVISCANPVVSLTATPLTAGASYVFSGSGVVSQSGNTAQVSEAGTYTVVVTLANGCSDAATVRVTAILTTPNAILAASNGGVLDCGDPILTLTAGPTTGVSYRFTSGATQQGTGNTARVQTPGVYSVTVTNTATGCFDVASVTVTQNTTPPSVSLSVSGLLTCDLTSVILTASGSGLVNYAFSGPGLSQNSARATASATQPGTYSVLITSATGCTALATASLQSNTTPPLATLSVSNSGVITCANRVLTLTASSGGVNYVFRGPGLNQTSPVNSATVTRAGTYSVTVSGTNGCNATALVVVTENNTPPNATLAASGILTCASPGVTITAGTVVGASYVFSGSGVVSQNGPRAIVDEAGTYTVVVTTPNGCSDAATVRVTATLTTPDATLVAANSGVLTCANPTLTLTAGPTTGVNYRFSVGATQQGTGNTAQVQTAGVYSVTVTNISTGCFDVASMSITQNTTPPSVSLSASGVLTCDLTSVILTATGSSLVNYAFSGPGLSQNSTRATASATQPGTYSVLVTSAIGCTALTTVTVQANRTLPVATLSAANSGTITCANRSITLVAGNTGVSYTFRGPGLNQTGISRIAIVTRAGTYSVTVTGANGCEATASIVVVENDTPPAASVVVIGLLTCVNPAVSLSASPAVAGASYAFSGPGVVSQNGRLALVNQAGTYSVTVTLANGCSDVATARVTATLTTPAATLAAANGGVLTCTNTSLLLTAGPNNGSTSFRFSPGATQYNNGHTAFVQTAGVYSVTATNVVSGCSNVASVSITQNTTTPTVSLSVSGPVTCNNQVVVLTASATPVNTYSFDGPGLDQSGTRATANIRQPGTYTVVVTASNGCTSQTTLTVAPPSLSISIAGSSSVCANQNSTLTASGAANYQWSTGAATARITIRPTNTSVFSVTGTTGSCISVKSLTVATFNCSARIATEEEVQPLQVKVLGNPTVNETVDVEIDGAIGNPLSLLLTDIRGQLLNQKVIESAALIESHTIKLGRSAGVYLLQVSTPTQVKTVKIVRQ